MVDLNELVQYQSTKTRTSGVNIKFYSNAQHALIASYLAEDYFDADVARACIAMICSDHMMIQESSNLEHLFSDLEKNISRRPIFEAFGVPVEMITSKKVIDMMHLMEAVEMRGVHGIHIQSKSAIPAPSVSEIGEISEISPRKAQMLLTVRIKELFGDLDGFDQETSLRASTMSDLFSRVAAPQIRQVLR